MGPPRRPRRQEPPDPSRRRKPVLGSPEDRREPVEQRAAASSSAPVFSAPPREVAKRILREIMSKMKDEAIDAVHLARRYPPRFITELVTLQEDGAINGPTASEVFEYSWLLAGALEATETNRQAEQLATNRPAEAPNDDAPPGKSVTLIGFGLRSPAVLSVPVAATLGEILTAAASASLSGFAVPKEDALHLNGRLTVDRALLPPDRALVASASAIKGTAARPAEVSASPVEIVSAFGLGQISDEAAILRAVEDAVAGNPKQLEQYRGGKESLFGYFVGQVMKATGGRANPALVNQLLKEKLSAKS